MRFFERFFSKLGYSKKAPSSLYANPIVTSGYTLGAGGHENYAKYLEQYADATWVFACVRRIATKAAGVPFVVMKKVRKNGKIGYETVQEHPVLDLLDKVNPHMTGADLRETTLSHLELTGNSYWFLDKFMRGKPTEIYPLCPSQVEIIPDKIDRIKAYNYKISEDKTISIPPEQIIHFKYFNSQDEYYGLSALSAGRLAVETQNLGDNYNKKFFENSAEPRGMLTSDNALTHEQRKQITHMWRTMHQGTANAHKSGLVDGGLKWMPIGLSQKDMEFIQSKKMTREDILGVFGVPPVMVGIFEYANYANSQEQREIFWKDTMVPKLKQIAGTINEFLVKVYDPNLKVEFDFSDVEELQEDEKVRAETERILIASGIMSINEVRLERGLPPIDGGDVLLKMNNLVDINFVNPMFSDPPKDDEPPKDKAPKEPEPTVEPPVTKKEPELEIEPIAPETKVEVVETPAEPELSAEEKRAAVRKEFRDKKWGVYKDVTEKLEKKWYPPLTKFFNDQEKTVLNNLERIGWKELCQEVRFKNNKQSDNKIDSIIFNIKDENKDAKKLATPRIEEAMNTQATTEIAELGLDIAFDLENPEVAKWIDKKSFKFANDVNTTTQEALRKTLKEAIKEGEGIPAVEKRITGVFDIAKGSRTEMIARTEVISATNQGAAEVYKQSEVVTHKEWISSRDGLVRDTHTIDGEVVKKEDKFSNGLMNPGDPTGDAGEIINCRCTQAGLTQEDL